MAGRKATFFDSLSLRSKGLLVVLIPLTAVLVVAASFYQYSRGVDAAEEWVNHSYEVGSQIRALSILVGNAEAGVRGYLLTGNRDYLRHYEESRREIPVRLANLKALVRDSAGATNEAAGLESLVRVNLDLMDRLSKVPPQMQSDAGARVLDASNDAVERLRAALEAMLAHERGLLLERTAQAERLERRLRETLVGGGIIGLLGGVLAALVFSMAIEKRIHQLGKKARSLVEGRQFEAEDKGRDEIANLESTLVESAGLLSQQSEQLRQARTELEAKVQRRTAQLQRANEELREANEVRTAIIRSSPLAIWAVDLSGNVTFWNPAAARIFGWTEDEVIGHPLPVVPGDLCAEYAEWLERFRRGEVLSGLERERVRKDGKRIHVEIWTAPLRDASGEFNGTIAIDSDVTDRKLLEEQFRRSQGLEAVGRLAGGVAHDFNNLLTVINGYCETLIEEAAAHPELVEYAKEIQYAGNRAASLTSQLLTFGRRQVSQPRLVDLNEVVKRSIQLVQRVIGEDVEVVTKLDPAACRVMVDPGHIDQVIMNLVVNARDAMSSGGRLTIETARTELDEHYTERHIGVEPGSYCLLAISDSGVGMTAEVKSRLFEPFFTTKPVGKGTGLGLSIVYGIVKQSRGEIGVYSEPGKGTTFKIYLPLAASGVVAEPVRRTPGELRGSETVLVCEDEERIRRLIQTVLERLGYRVLASGDPREAMQLAGSNDLKIDLLLTDVVMPHGNGFELAGEMQRLRPDLKIMYMSGYADHHLAGSRILEMGAAFLQKPFAATALAQKVKEVLAGTSDQPASTRSEG
jgi:PAS domain S-box-containing protein